MRLKVPRVPTAPRVPNAFTASERWRFRNPRPTNHPRTSFQTRVWGTRSQRWFYVDGVLSAILDVAVVQFLAVYAIALGATDAEVGMLSIAVGLAGLLALVPGARVAEVANSRRWVVLFGGSGLARVVIFLMAATPTIVRDPHDGVFLLIALAFARSFMINASHSSWVSLLADIVPLDLRRFYVTQRMLAMTVAGAITAPLVGFGIRAIGGIVGYQVIFFVSFMVGVAAWYAYFRIEEPPRLPRAQRPRGSTREMLADRPFMRYLWSLLLLNATTMIVGPFFMAYLIRDLGGSVSDVGLLATLEQVLAVGGQFVLGLWVTRFSSEKLFKFSMFFPALIPLLWYFAGEPWHAAFPFAMGGLVWAIYNVTTFNLLMEYAPNDNIPRYAAVQQTVVLFASFIGPVVGTVVVAAWGIRAAMLISVVGRLLAALVMFIPLRWIPAIRVPLGVPPEQMIRATDTRPPPPAEGASTAPTAPADPGPDGR